VTVFEKVAELKPLGDIISFGQVCCIVPKGTVLSGLDANSS
jgi:hypothetical protein